METPRKKRDLWPLIVGTIAAIGIIGSNSTGGITKTTREPAATTAVAATANASASTGMPAATGPASTSMPAATGPAAGPTGASPSGPAGSQAIRIVESPADVKAGGQASVTIIGQPGVTYDIVLAFGRDTGGVSGMEPKQADAEGRVSWQWRVPVLSARGTYTVTITGGGQQAASSFTVS